MNPVLQAALTSILRHVLTGGATYLVTRGIWTAEEASTYVLALALAIIGLGWAVWQKYGAQQKLVTALTMPAGTTEAAVERRIDSGIGVPSVTTPKTDVPVAAPKG